MSSVEPAEGQQAARRNTGSSVLRHLAARRHAIARRRSPRTHWTSRETCVPSSWLPIPAATPNYLAKSVTYEAGLICHP